MIVHRLLDAFFRTLDAVDAVRDRVDRVLGKEPRPDPWAVEWPPAEPDLPSRPETEPDAKSGNGATAAATPAEAPASAEAPAEAAEAAPAAPEPAKKKAASKKPSAAKKKKSQTAKPKPVAKKASSSRKGSVDRVGKDFDSPRAEAINGYVRDQARGVITEDADLGGKKVLARVVWALEMAEDSGEGLGLTTADTSALLHLASGIEVFSTNIGRACRDHSDLIEETEPDGRSKRYKLTAEGRAQAKNLDTRAL
jgi:hypothetical protein